MDKKKPPVDKKPETDLPTEKRLPLTMRETQIAYMTSRDLTNQEIGAPSTSASKP